MGGHRWIEAWKLRLNALLSVLLLVALAVCERELEQDRRHLLFSSRFRPNILNRRFNPEARSTTTTPTPEETTTIRNHRVRLPTRRPNPRFELRPPLSLKAKIEQQMAEKTNRSSAETEVISDPQPNQEFVAFVANDAPTEVHEDKQEPKILTEPIPGHEFVAFQASRPSLNNAVITSENGDVVLIHADDVPISKPEVEELTLREGSANVSSQEAHVLDAILITPDEVLPFENSEPATEAVPEYIDEETEKDLALLLSHEEEASDVTVAPLRKVTVLEPELETFISVVTSIPTKEVEGESMHVEHHMEFEHSHTGPENDTLWNEPQEIFESVTKVIPELDYIDLNIPSEYVAEVKEEVITEEPSYVTEAPSEADVSQANIEILSTVPKDQTNPPVNYLYGKYFDESNLNFGKGVSEDDKLLFPSETEQKVRSKIEIKEVNGQLYEYEYIYYYDDEYPLYDYESNAPVDVDPSSAPATTSTTTTTTTTTTTPAPTTTPKPTTTTSHSLRGNIVDSRRIRGRRPVVTDQEVNIIEEPTRGSERSRLSLNLPSRSSRGRNREDEVLNDNTVQAVTVEEAKLPSQTRFPPRATTPSSRFREPLFQETEVAGFSEHKQIPLIPEVTGLHTHGREALRSGRTFEVLQEEITTDIAPTSTVSPTSRSLVNLYAFSRAADGEDIADATTQTYDYDTKIPFIDVLYEYEDFVTEYPGTESPAPEPAAEPEPEPSTEEPTTSTSTTTTTTSTTTSPPTTSESQRSRNRFASRPRGTRFHNRPTSVVSTPADDTKSRDTGSRFNRTRSRNSNTFRGLRNNDEPVSENAVESTSEATERNNLPRRTPISHRFRPSIGTSPFSRRVSSKPESTITESPSTVPPLRRPNLTSRADIFRNRLRGRGTTATEEVSTEPTEEVAAEAPVEVVVGDVVESNVEISTESAQSPATTATSPFTHRTRGRPNFNRPRFGVRGSTRHSATQDEPRNDVNKNATTQAPRTTSIRGRERTKPLPRLRPSSGHRGVTLTEKPEVPDENTPVDELLSDDQPQDHPTEELLEQETPLDVPEENTQGTEERSRQSPARGNGGTRNILNRFRARTQSAASIPATKAPKKQETTPTPRRGSLSSLFQVRKPRPVIEPKEEPQIKDPEIPAVDESQPSEIIPTADIQHAEAPEVPVEEAGAVAEVTPETVAEEIPAEEPSTEKPHRRFSFFSRRRNRN
ncbi:hypothetical protein SK128_021231 [Halocaridina rubra]|uniref:Uncharacterized protein n=1 Tax=Halocaridina rubra TaxID=373956 RepID=A0AAN8X8Q8_HALRR